MPALLTVSVTMVLVIVAGTVTVSAQVWCGRAVNSEPLIYRISTTLNYVAYELGVQDMLNNDVVRYAANSWNQAKNSGRLWPVLEKTVVGSYDVLVSIDYGDDADSICSNDSVLGYYDSSEALIAICIPPFEEGYYESAQHVQSTFGHEFGHFLGSGHLSVPSLMYPTDSYSVFGIYAPNSNDKQNLNDLYEPCYGSGGPPMCQWPPYICEMSASGGEPV